MVISNIAIVVVRNGIMISLRRAMNATSPTRGIGASRFSVLLDDLFDEFDSFSIISKVIVGGFWGVRFGRGVIRSV